jgi:hypothetical protein
MRDSAIRFAVHYLLLPALCLSLAGLPSIAGQHVLREVGEEGIAEPVWLVLPYAYYGESTELAFGVAGGGRGYWQDQLFFFAAAQGSTNGTTALFFYMDDIQLHNRLFMGFNASLGNYTSQRTYVDGNPEFKDQNAGSNDSDPDDFVEGPGLDNWMVATFRYVLPFGHARDAIINTYYLDRGILVEGSTGGAIWNPLKAGRTTVEAELFYRLRSFESEENEIGEGRTNGIELAMEYDNRDFAPNPMQGSLQRIELARDFGWFQSTHPWTVLSGDVRKYIPLGPIKGVRHQVLALDAWTSVSPTWEEQNGMEVHRTPNFKGATLGGQFRMRAFPKYRYNDKAAIFYCAEYRLIPNWNPLGEMQWLRFFEIDWWQFVPFIEAGRVAPQWSLKTLHQDMKWDAGLGIRLMAKKSVVRLDTAFAEESWSVWAMVGQPF